jgi:hypothetical protein
MVISKDHIETIINEFNIEYSEKEYSHLLQLGKNSNNHYFEFEILKNGQYIYIILNYEGNSYSIEHIEFYMNESLEEVIKELTYQIGLLSMNKTRIKIQKRFWKSNISVEVNQKNKWEELGYRQKLVFKKKAST